MSSQQGLTFLIKQWKTVLFEAIPVWQLFKNVNFFGCFSLKWEHTEYVTRSKKRSQNMSQKLSFIYGWKAHNISFNLVYGRAL